jgi:hypothetical protein
MVEKVIIPVIVAAIIGAIAWVARSLFLIRPKLEVRYAHADGQSSVGVAGGLAVRWGYKVTISNLSKHDALEVRVLQAATPEAGTLPADYLKGLDRLELAHNLVKELDRDTVVQARHDFHGALEPAELKRFCLVLRYRNDSGLTFYTNYQRINGVDMNSFSIRRPKGAA